MITAAAIVVGFMLDMLVGDPRFVPHPVVLMGKLIAGAEKLLRRVVPSKPASLRWAGMLLGVGLCALACGASAAVLQVSGWISPWLRFVVEALMCWQVLAAKELWRQSTLVATCFAEQGLAAARSALSYIVGRDTAELDRAGIARATVETVAENAADGVIAPLFFLAIGGAPLGVLYKAINTMDSMIGYKNEAYRFFGWFAARLDDVANFLPARITSLCLVAAAPFAGLSAKGAWAIMRRDAHNHESPNAGFAEAAMAGALGVQLGGDALYQGALVHKPTLGDATREVQLADIARANKVMILASVGALLLFVCARMGIFLLLGEGFVE